MFLVIVELSFLRVFGKFRQDLSRESQRSKGTHFPGYFSRCVDPFLRLTKCDAFCQSPTLCFTFRPTLTPIKKPRDNLYFPLFTMC